MPLENSRKMKSRNALDTLSTATTPREAAEAVMCYLPDKVGDMLASVANIQTIDFKNMKSAAETAYLILLELRFADLTAEQVKDMIDNSIRELKKQGIK